MDNLITKESLGQKLVSIISNALRIDNEKITPDSRIINDLNAESLDILDIRFSIEQELGLKIGEHEIVNTIGNGLSSAEFLEKFTVSNLIDLLADKLNSNEQEQ
jgi:acyl carrier protein